MFGISPGPFAAGPAGREPLDPGQSVQTFLLAIDPPVTKGAIQSFGVGNGGFSRIFFKETHPKTVRLVVVLFKPNLKMFGGTERDDLQLVRVCHLFPAHRGLQEGGDEEKPPG